MKFLPLVEMTNSMKVHLKNKRLHTPSPSQEGKTQTFSLLLLGMGVAVTLLRGARGVFK